MVIAMFTLVCANRCASQETDTFGVSVVTATDEVLNGQLQSLSEALEIQTDTDPARQLTRDSLVSITRRNVEVVSADPQTLTLLMNGDVLAGQPVRVLDESLIVEWTGTDPATMLSVPLEFVRAVVFAQPTDEIARQRLQRQWALTQSETDRLFLLNGTYANGELAGLDPDKVMLTTRFGAVETARNEVAVVSMSSELAAQTPPSTDYGVLLTLDGSRLTLQDLTIAAQLVAGRTVFGEQVQVPIDRFDRLQMFSERVQSLVDREVDDYDFTPYLTERHGLVKHRNVHGGPLQLRKTRFATGLGVHSKCDVTWDLTGAGFRAFTATIGVDDMADGQGHVVFSVSVDGERVYESPGISGSDQPLPIGPIDITNAQRLTLSVDFGRAGNIRDIADWCDPLLTR